MLITAPCWLQRYADYSALLATALNLGTVLYRSYLAAPPSRAFWPQGVGAEEIKLGLGFERLYAEFIFSR